MFSQRLATIVRQTFLHLLLLPSPVVWLLIALTYSIFLPITLIAVGSDENCPSEPRIPTWMMVRSEEALQRSVPWATRRKNISPAALPTRRAGHRKCDAHELSALKPHQPPQATHARSWRCELTRASPWHINISPLAFVLLTLTLP